MNNNNALANFDQKFVEENRIATLKTRIENLAKWDIEDPEIIPDYQWYYHAREKRLTYVEKDLGSMTDREVVAKSLSCVGHSIFSADFDPVYVRQLVPTDADTKKSASFFTNRRHLMNLILDYRVNVRMERRYPWTHDSFWYYFLKEDSKMSALVENDMPKNVQYLFMVKKLYWNEPLLKVHPDVFNALRDTESMLERCYTSPTLTAALDIIRNEIRPIYVKLVEDDDNEDADDNRQQQIQDAFENLKTMAAIQQKLQEMSDWHKADAEKNKAEGEEKQNFAEDIDKQFDDAESAKAEAAKYGQDEVANKSVSQGHEEPTLAKDDYLTYEKMYAEVYPVLNYFVKSLRSIMKDNAINRTWGNYRSGTLNTNKLFRLSTKCDKVFKRKVHRRHKDYAVTLLIDESGSMCSSEKNRNAAKAAILFAEVLNKVGIKFEVRAFNASHRCYKKFNEPYKRKQRRNMEKIIINSHSSDARCNNDWFAVNQAMHNLRMHGNKETERMLFVFSDGLPAEDSGLIPVGDRKRLPSNKQNYNKFDLKYEVTEWGKHAYVCGIGIKARHVGDYYKNNALCDDVLKLPRLLMSKLKHNIRRW